MSFTNNIIAQDLEAFLKTKMAGENVKRITVEVVTDFGERKKFSTRVVKVSGDDYQWADTVELL